MALKFRRGTTAQQSGSLAFGEPFVNTTLGTLLVGGNTGDIVLAVAGTGSTGTFGPISGSGLDITGNANIAGNLTLGGNITIGDAGTDTIAINADLSSSLIPNNDNAFTIGTAALRYSNIYGVNIIGSIASTNGVVSGSSQVTLQSTTGFTAYNTALSTITGSLISTASANTISITNINTVTASALTRFTNLETTTASLNTSVSNLNTFSASVNSKAATLATYTGSVDGKFTTIGTVTASYDGRFTSLATITGSLISSASNANGRLSAIEAVSGTFARTNSANTFNGNQTITGSLYITQDLVVQGSSSIQNVSSSTLNIGTNIITVAVNQPSVRFGGLSIIDSGSSGQSGSFLYDSVQDEFIFVHKGNGTNITSSHFVLGPETIDNLGNETYLTNNRLAKGTGKEHLNDSNITDTGTLITLGSNSVVNGTFYATGATLVSGSSQVIGILSSLNSYTASNDTTNTTQTSRLDQLSTASGSAITRLTALEVETSNLETYTGSFAAASVTLTNKTISGASNTLSNIANASLTNSSVTVTAGTGMSGGGAVSLGGSVTLTNAGVTSNVAGTGVTVSGATGAVTISIGQSVATTATPTFGNLTINGTITATGDITAYYTSDKRHKNNIQTISNAVLKVKQLNGVTWEWNDDVNEVTKSTPKTGLIAQEVQSVLPQVVTERNDGFLALDYSKMVGLLVEAIKEQQTQIDKLKAQIGSK